MVFKNVIELAPYNESLNELSWFDSEDEGIISMEYKFGEILPIKFSDHSDINTDKGLIKLCFFGCGQWYLQKYTASKHSTPPNSIECNLEYLCKYNTRNSWIKYGATVYFDYIDSINDNILTDQIKILGIWCCHYNKLILPGDNNWEHAKSIFRMSLITSLTLKDHLSYTHWIIANGIMVSSYEETNIYHPIRRLLHQFCYKTLSINYSATKFLLPVDNLAFRIWGFTKESWKQYFSDIFNDYKFKTFPEIIKAKNIPDNILKKLPFYIDGIELWHCIEKYVISFLKIFYSEDIIKNDNELKNFWNHFENQIDCGWNLPELTFDNS